MKKENRLKAHLIFLAMDLIAVGTYFTFDTLSEISNAITTSSSEIIVNEVSFYILIVFFIPAFHLLVTLDVHTALQKQTYREKFNAFYLAFTFGIAIFSGHFASIYTENKLESNEYHFCENLSYEKTVRGATHYVWRAKEVSCENNQQN